ncbi:dermonecrotic toxin domain-containing protein [Pseudomonas monteilii]|uniref:dermonecrotic toxin domain-containing protein n=1 Tax=Pseudomonas monteilii TaxID=76759 RepID=UPI00383AB29B
MPETFDTQTITFKQLVASRFAKRPTLRGVIGKVGFAVLADRYPWITRNHPQLNSLGAFTLMHGEGKEPGQVALVDTLLEHFLTGGSLAFTDTDMLSIVPPAPFRPQEQGADPSTQPEINLSMQKLNEVFDEVLASLPQAFQHAQIGFWAASDATSAFSPLHWLAQTLKAALLGGMEQQGLAAPERNTLYGLINGSDQGLVVNGLQVTLDDHPPQTLPDLLITGTSGRVLWCKPCGAVRSHEGLAAFAEALRDELAQRYPFSALRWARQPLDTDPFHYQAMALLNGILDRIGRLQLSALTGVQELEAAFSALSDPSVNFLDLPLSNTAQPLISLPAWLTQADTTGRMLYGGALLELAASHAQAQGKTSFEAIAPLDRYAADLLRKQMRLDHPGKAPHDPDQLLVEISVVVPLSSSGPAQLQYLKSMTLTELAVSRLHTDANEVASGLADTHARPLDSWLNLDYVNALISKVDVGGQYPAYVTDQLKDTTLKATRIRCHTTQWRNTLRFAALEARLKGQLRAHTCQAIVDFCRATATQTASLTVAPLAFLPAPGATKGDRVHGMFLINIHASQVWALYRPLFAQDTLIEFASLDSLMARIRTDQALQQSLLAWMDDDARVIYQQGGFERPHLHPGLSALAHLLGTESALVDAIVERLKVPVSAWHKPWSEDLDSHLYEARIQALLLLASRQSTSNAQQRWALIVQLAWVVFNTVTPLVRGPAATLAWLVAALATLKDDLPALYQGSPQEQAMAAADLLSNLAMLLMHTSSGQSTSAVATTATPALALEGLATRAPFTSVTVEPPTATDWVAHEQSRDPSHIHVESWRNSQRVGNLPAEARQRLAELRATVSLQGHAAETHGRLRGLYKVGEQLYVKLQDVAYEVHETWGGVQIIGPETHQGEWQSYWGGAPDGYYIVGRERSKGPWLTRWNEEWVLDLSLAGGMPKTREAITAQNRQQFEALQTDTQANQAALNKLEPLMERNREQLEAFDDKAAAFTLAFNALPNPDVSTLPEALAQQRTELLRLRNVHMSDIAAAALYLEKQTTLLHANVDIFRKMLEPRFLKYDRSAATPRRLSNWTETAIDTDMLLLRRLLELIDHEKLQEQSMGLRWLPGNEEQKQRHSTFRESTRHSLKVSRRLLKVSERLDSTLPLALSDARVDYPDKNAKIERTIKLRPYSSLIVRAQIISDLAYLTLDKTLLTAEAAAELLPLQVGLSNKDLSASLWNHDGLASTNLPADQQVEVLNNVLRDYRAALGKAQYLQSFTEPALDTQILDEYINEMTGLERMAETELSCALASVERGTLPAPRSMAHRTRPGKQTLIRTSRGRPVLVEQDPQGERAVQHNPATQQPAGTYERREGEWHEVVGNKAAPSQDTAQLRRRAQSLLTQKDARIASAARYAHEPNSLADLLDWQVEDMREVEQQLSTAHDQPSTTLSARLRDAIAAVSTEKQRLLTNAYLGTRHPDSTALRYLHQQKRLQITLTQSRKALRNANDYLDVYQIKDVQAPKNVLWEAHFHYRSADAAPKTFAKGHLKLWEPRLPGDARLGKEREAQLEKANTAAERIEIYRGDLRPEQVEGIIPFPAT